MPTPDDPDRRWTCEECGQKFIGDAQALEHCDEAGHSLALGREELERVLGPEWPEAFPGLADVVKISGKEAPGE